MHRRNKAADRAKTDNAEALGDLKKVTRTRQLATKALADAEARRLDREQNAEKYAAEDAARRVSEAEAKIGDADVVRLRKVYEEACDADGRLPVPNLLTAFAKLTGTKPQWEEGVALAGGPGAVVGAEVLGRPRGGPARPWRWRPSSTRWMDCACVRGCRSRRTRACDGCARAGTPRRGRATARDA